MCIRDRPARPRPAGASSADRPAGRRQSRVKYRPYDLDHTGDGMPPELWRLLHRPLHLQRHPRYAQRRTGCPLKGCHELPRQLRGVLHRPFHYESDTGHAKWETGWRQMRAAWSRQSMPRLRKTGTASVLCRITAGRRYVRNQPRDGDTLVERTGASHPPR